MSCSITAKSPGTKNITCTANTKIRTNIVAGDTCWENAQCKSNSCQDGVCTGVGFNQTCTRSKAFTALDDNCAVGFWCNKTDNKCANLPAIGATCDMTNGPPCPYNSLCHTGTDGNKTCVRKGTVDNDVVVDQNNRDLCKTFSVAKNGSDYICYDGERLAPENNMTFPDVGSKVCQFQAKNSSGSWVNNTAMDIAHCGYGTLGLGYCGLRRGDSQFVDKLGDLQGFLERDRECHYQTSIQYCNDIEGKFFVSSEARDYIQLILRTENDEYNAKVSDVSECAKETIAETMAYWRAVAGASSLASSAIALITVAALYVLA